MKTIKTLLVAAFFALATTLIPAGLVSAQGVLDEACSTSDSAICNNTEQTAGDVIGVVINTLLFIVGALSVIMIIYGGIRYTTSAGDAAKVTSAKNTITYAIVGLVVSFLAFAVVNWVLQLF